jgi:type III restriction enzyme
MLDRQMEGLQLQYNEVYLLRNEGHFAIYNFTDGKAFEPDFVLFMREKTGKMLVYQLFIEPKGKHIKDYDRWKEAFLKEITKRFGKAALQFKDRKYRLLGVPFYNIEDENQFKASLEAAILGDGSQPLNENRTA